MSKKTVKHHAILEELNTNKNTTRQELVQRLKMPDVRVRKMISEAKMDNAIIFDPKNPGYRLAKRFEECSREELEREISECQRCVNYLMAIEKRYNQQKRAYIAYIKSAEKHLKKEEEVL